MTQMIDEQPGPAVVIVMPLADQRGGAELSLLQLLKSSTSIRWHVVFLEDGPMVAQARALGIPVRVVPGGRVRKPWIILAAIRTIVRWAREVDAKGMLGWMAEAHLYSGPAAKLMGIPAVWFQHGLPSKYGVIDNLANRIWAVGAMACSQYSADCQLAVTPKLPMRVVHPGADLERFDPSQLPSPEQCRAELGLPKSGPIVGIFGRLQSWKGMHVFIDSFPAVLAKYPDATAVIVGGVWQPEAAYEQQLHEQVKRLEISERVVFAGHQTNIARWMQACDVIVHHSDREPFGMVVVEAMALGKSVIAGTTGGPKEAITDGVTGSLVSYGDATNLNKAILSYLDDPALAAKVGEAARQRAQYFSVDRFANGVSSAMRDWIYSTSA